MPAESGRLGSWDFGSGAAFAGLTDLAVDLAAVVFVGSSAAFGSVAAFGSAASFGSAVAFGSVAKDNTLPTRVGAADQTFLCDHDGMQAAVQVAHFDFVSA